MRKPRDYNAEIEVLADRAKMLKTRHVTQLGELVIACKADALPIEILAGALLATADADAPMKEAWQKRGAAFFSRASAATGQGAGAKPGGAASNTSGAQ